ncbi:uncharacterized protein LOC120452659 isoform X2 [Drosophila santomea]|uniref:uncharacterized protein LOC120452659 isoform X2 n=1 Tax=Drosophila santomea TaxID=129105 RepID=UPI00195387CF|nr:uncharacterized protein LOC120452659 isoform X2 [Drosophila santomea]
MATFQMEMRQQQKQQHQQTNLRQRAAAVATCKARRQRQHLQPESTDSPQHGTDCIRLWPGCGPSTADRVIGNSPTCNNTSSSNNSSSNISSSNSSSISGCSCNFGRQRALIMLSMLVVVMALMSGNGVYAAQRDSYNSKDMSSSNNALPNEGVGGSAAGAGEAAAPGPTGVAGSEGGGGSGNNSSGNNKNGHPAAGSGAASESAVLTTDASRSSSGSSSGSSTTITGIPSSSLHKASSASSNTFSSQLTSGFHRNSIDLEEARNAGPYFDKAFSKNVTALLGKTAYLNCRVKNLGNKTMLLQVSWVRHRDIHLLTVGRYTYTSDQRFRAIHQPQTEDWMLQIKYPQHRDSGIYECQVSTTPHMSHYIHLNVVEPSTEIIGAPDLYIESGSTINLTCIIQNSPEPPAYIFWNHNNAFPSHPQIINYDSPRGGVSVVTNKGDTTTSFLLIKSARPSDSGHYQCNPSNAKPKSVTVHVLNGVSHSVSRGVPSSNAARGTSASSPLAHSLSVCVPVCVLLQLGACRWIAALLGAALATPPPVRVRSARRATGKRPGPPVDRCAPLASEVRHFLASVLRWRWRWSWRWHWKGTQQEHSWHYVKPQSRREAATCRQPFEADIR